MVLRSTEALGFIRRKEFYSRTVVENDLTVVAVPSLEHSVSTQNA
jgi:hypothetical protein